jgi:predicted MPP superfamily phosphohydrolase
MGISRRGALRALAASGVGLGAGTVSYGMAYERYQIALVNIDVPVIGLPSAVDGLRIGLITDLHHSDSVPAAHISRAVALLRDSRPDLIVLGGDYVSFLEREYVGPVAELLAPLAHAPHGSFAVLGNHDDDRDMPTALEQQGFTVLKDQRTRVSIRGEPLELAGLRFWTRRPAEIGRVLNGTTGTTILLAAASSRCSPAPAATATPPCT